MQYEKLKADTPMILKLLKIALFILPLAWITFLTWILRLFSLQVSYSLLRREHYELANRPLGAVVGNQVFEAYEYMATAQRDYLMALLTLLMSGILPALVVYFSIAAYKVFRKPRRS